MAKRTGRKATPDRSAAALLAWKTRRALSPFAKVRASEAASKAAFNRYCIEHGWRVAFFEGPTGSPRTGIIDAVAFRLQRANADAIEIRLVQLKGGRAGITGAEIARLRKAVSAATVDWLIAAFDGQALQLVPDLPTRLTRGPRRSMSAR